MIALHLRQPLNAKGASIILFIFTVVEGTAAYIWVDRKRKGECATASV